MKYTKYIVLAAVAIIGVFALGQPDNKQDLGASIIDTEDSTKNTSELDLAGDNDSNATDTNHKNPPETDTVEKKPLKRSIVPDRELTEDDMVELLGGLWGPSQKPPPGMEEELQTASEMSDNALPNGVEIADKGADENPGNTDPKEDAAKANNAPGSEQAQDPGEDKLENIIYEDGTYSVIGEYKSSNGHESIAVEMVIESNTVTSVKVVPLTLEDEERELQEMFAKDVVPYIVGEKVVDIPRFASVSGGSAVPNGFQDAIEKIQLEAKAAVQHKFQVIPRDDEISDELKDYLKQLEQEAASESEQGL